MGARGARTSGRANPTGDGDRHTLPAPGQEPRPRQRGWVSKLGSTRGHEPPASAPSRGARGRCLGRDGMLELVVQLVGNSSTRAGDINDIGADRCDRVALPSRLCRRPVRGEHREHHDLADERTDGRPGRPADVGTQAARLLLRLPDRQHPARANSDLTIEPAERTVAQAQASRFSSVCNIWAPMYRQVTLSSLGSGPVTARVAYDSLHAGWEDHLQHDNDGRPIVFLGHSQGSAI